MNEKEIKVLSVLKENSRASIKDISKLTKIKPSTVYQTLIRLKENKIIEKFTIKLNDKLIGKNFVVFMLVLTSNHIPNSFFNRDEIVDVFGITGEYDLFMKLKFKDVDEFNSFVMTFRDNKNIVKTHTLVATTMIKES